MKMNKRCQGCGEFVSDKFVKVYGDNEDEVQHCISCLGRDEGGREMLRRGAAAKGLEEITA